MYYHTSLIAILSYLDDAHREEIGKHGQCEHYSDVVSKGLLNSRAEGRDLRRLPTVAAESRYFGNESQQAKHSHKGKIPLIIDRHSGSTSQAAKRKANRVRRRRNRKENETHLA